MNAQKLPKQSTLENWNKTNPYLCVKNNLMICSLCEMERETDAFVEGCSNFQKSAVECHTTSNTQRKAVSLQEQEKADSLGQRHQISIQVWENALILRSISQMGRLSDAEKESHKKLL